MKFLSTSLSIAATLAASVIAAPGPHHARALEQVHIYSRFTQLPLHQLLHHETAHAIADSMEASRQAASDSLEAFYITTMRGHGQRPESFDWWTCYLQHLENADSAPLKRLCRQHRRAAKSAKLTVPLYYQVHEDKAVAERRTAEAKRHSSEAATVVES